MSLLQVKIEYPSVWEGFQPYLSNLPGEEDVHTLFSFRKELIPLLQDAEMVSRWTPAIMSCFPGRCMSHHDPLCRNQSLQMSM